MRKGWKKLASVFLSGLLVTGYMPTNVYAAESQYKEPLVFEDFEEKGSVQQSANNAVVEIKEGSATGSGNKVASLQVTSSGSPDYDNRSIIVSQESSIDVSQYKYLTFWIKDPGVNTAYVGLVDESGKNAASWTSDNNKSVAGKWTQFYMNLDSYKDIDLTKVKSVFIGQWNRESYLIDDVYFTDVLASELTLKASKASGTYNDAFEVQLSADENQKIYYTTDGSQPTLNSKVYSGAIQINDDMVIKAIVADNNNISQVYEYVYKINHEDNSNYTPVLVQTFENQSQVQAADNAEVEITTDDQNSGKKSLKYIKKTSEGTSKTNGSVKIYFDHAVDVEDLKYLIFYTKDTQGSNTMQISLIDSNGNESSYDWCNVKTVKNQWSQYYVRLSSVKGIDKSKVAGIRIGQWNTGTYYVDDIYFENFLSNDIPSTVPEKPVSNVDSGYKFKDQLKVSLKNDSSAPMYYTLDGSDPTKDSQEYKNQITINDTTTLKVVSYANGQYSDVVELKYVKDKDVLSDVIASKSEGKYAKAIDVELFADGEDIYYTLDGSTPTKSSEKYSKAIHIEKTTTLKAVSMRGNISGNVMTFEYKYPTTPAKVTVNTDKRLFNKTSYIELLSDPDAKIYYTVDGSTPTVDSKVADGMITIDKTMTIKAMAVRDEKQSQVSSFDFVIAPENVEADKKAGTYEGSVIVEFRVPSTDQVEIYYTTDGTDPKVSEDNHYTQPIKVSKDTTFKVAATFKNSDSLGEVTTHKYIIQPVTKVVAPVITPSSGTYGQKQLVSMTSDTKDGEIYYTLDGTTPTKASQKFTKDFYVKKDTIIKAMTVKDDQVSEVTENKIMITNEKSAFLKTDGNVIRNNYGAGEVVQLKGTNIGGWLVMENWQCPTNSPDQKTTLKVLTERFGEDKAWELINTYQDHWFSEKDFDVLKDEGVNVLRLPITYFEMANEDGTLKDTAFDRLDWFIEQAAKRNIYTLIDMHGAFGSQNGKDHSGDISNPDVGHFFDNEENIQKTIKLWEKIAERYNGNEWVAGYDLLNEPGGAVGTKQFEAYDRLYDAIRAIDQDHIIQMQAIWEPTHLPNPKLYGWENVVYQYHFYGWNVETDAEGQKEFIESKVKFLEDTNFNVPTFVGEFTFFSNEKSWDCLDIFDQEGWSYTSWTYKVSGDNSSWGMYTMPNNSDTKVDIYNDSFDVIQQKWSAFDFTRNDKYAEPLHQHFISITEDKDAPVISGNNAKVELGTELTVEEIIDLFVKDERDGVIDVTKITTEFDANKEGKYDVIVEAVDKAGNKSEKKFTITVEKEVEQNQPGDNEQDNPGQDKPDQDNKQNNDIDVNKNVKTGDDTQILAYVALLGISLIAGFSIYRKKRVMK